MELTDCLCINCEEMINPGLFEIHSKVCFCVSNHVKRLEEFDDTTILDYKIDKLKCALEGNLHSGQLDDSMLNPHFRKLISVATELMMISGDTEDDFSRCNDKLNELGDVAHIKNFQFIIYYERLKHLGLVIVTQAKAELILTRVNRKQNLCLDEELNKQNEELERLKEQLVFYKKKATVMQGLINRRIDDVRSEVNSVCDSSISSKSRGSSVSSMSSFFEDEPSKLDTLEDELVDQKFKIKENTEEGMRRYFYSQCIVIKLSLGRNYKRNVSIAQLYQVRDI
jgi:hypothetical protein